MGTLKTREASCSCGQLRLVATGEPVRVSICHCLNCQRRTGSPFAQQARFPKEAVVLRGESTQYQRIGDSGNGATFHFCPICGDTVCFYPSVQADFVVVPVGAFADPTFPAPTLSVYTERKHGWVTLPPDIEHL
jgi:hypothetical protein